MKDTPKGWELTKLSQIVSLKTGPFGSALHKSDYINGGVPLINPIHIRSGELIPASDVTVSVETSQRLAEFRLVENDIVMGRRGEMGRCAVVGATQGGWLCGTGSVIIRPTESVNSEFLQRFLSSPITVTTLIGDSVGSTMVNLNQSVLLGLDVPLAPLPEQKRIADKLDAVLARVDACRDRLERVPALLKRFRQSVLAAATSGRLTEDWRAQVGWADAGSPTPAGGEERWASRAQPNLRAAAAGIEPASESSPRTAAVGQDHLTNNPYNWQDVALSSVCLSITDGDHQAPPQVESGIPFITISAINDGRLSLERASRFVSREYFYQLKDERKPIVGDVLFSVTGSICIPALVTEQAEFTFQRHIAILKPNRGVVTSKYLYFMLGSDAIKKQGLEVATGTAQLTVPLKGLRNFSIALPPLEEQHEIVRRVETLFAFADRLEARLAAARNAADKLTPALLAKAFRGELVPQDPNDEPAAELLQRLAASRAEAGAKPRRSRSKTAATL